MISQEAIEFLETEWRNSQAGVDDIDIFKGDIEDILTEKIPEIEMDLKRLKERLEFKTYLRANRFREDIKGRGYSQEQKEMMWGLVYMFHDSGLRERIEELEKELSRLKRVKATFDSRFKNIKPKGGITDDDIINAKGIPIERFYEGQLRRTSNKLMGRCPFHEEKTGSFFIYVDSNTYHCFGCGRGGDVISFIQNSNGLSFLESVKFILGR